MIDQGPAFFAHSTGPALELGKTFGCSCKICERKIAAPHEFQGQEIWCLYCGMEHGLVPMVEVPCGLQYSYGITGKECLAIERVIERGKDLDSHFQKMAEQNGQILFSVGC